MKGNIEVQRITNAKELDTVFEIRQKVFVEEQQVDPALEYDDFEDTSRHFIAYKDGVPCGTARWRKTPNGIKLERFAVLSEFRRKNVGSELVKSVLNDLPNKDKVYLHAQTYACKLYEKFGFTKEGDLFLEANIEHYKMVLT